MNPEELFNENYYIAETTVKKLFGDPRYIAKKHGVSLEDLHQYAREALWEASLAFDNTKGNRTFRNFAITSIRWHLIERLRRDCKKFSFRGTGIKPRDIVDKLNVVSLDAKPTFAEDEDSTYYDVVRNNFDTESEVFGNLLEDKMNELFPPRTVEFVKLKLKGKTIYEIGKLYGISHQAVDQNIRQHAKKLSKVI
jgi:RNA polymerase sigma factor (sigma-70 family)